MNCYVDYLEYLAETLTQADQPALRPASPESLGILEMEIISELNTSVPQAYIEFLGHANGFYYNGVCWFSGDPCLDLPQLIEENRQLRAQATLFDNYLILGQSGLWYYAYHSSTNSYRALQIDALDEPYYTFEDFDDCVCSSLEESLELLEEEPT